MVARTTLHFGPYENRLAVPTLALLNGKKIVAGVPLGTPELSTILCVVGSGTFDDVIRNSIESLRKRELGMSERSEPRARARDCGKLQ